MRNQKSRTTFGSILFLSVFLMLLSQGGRSTVVQISDRDPELIKILYANEYMNNKHAVSDMIDKITPVYKIENKEEYKKAVTHASIRYEVPPELIIATIAVESEFKQNSKSTAGAVGPMQVVPKYWKTDSLNPHTLYGNIQLGTKALKTYKTSCGKWSCAFKAYNVGITNYNKGNMIDSQKIYFARIEKAIATL